MIEMKNPFKTTTIESSQLAAQIKNLTDKSVKLAARLANAEKAAEAARAARSDNLAEADEAEMDRLIASVSNAEGTISALTSTLQEVERQLADAREKHALALENERRTSEADALESAAGEVDKRLSAVAAASKTLKMAVSELYAAIPEGLAIWPSWDRPEGIKGYGGGGASEVVSALVAEIAYSTHSNAVAWSFWRGSIPVYDITFTRYSQPSIRHEQEGRDALPIAEAGKRLITDRLKALAAELRTGNETAKMMPAKEPEGAELMPEVEILITKAFKYRILPSNYTSGGAPQFQTIEGHKTGWLPKLVAHAAIAAECAQLADTKETKELARYFGEEQRRSQNTWRTDPEDLVDLGDPLNIENTFQPSTPRLVA